MEARAASIVMIKRSTILAGTKYDIETVESVGSDGVPNSRAIVRHPGSVIILPLLRTTASAEPSVVLIRNHRITLERSIVELPAGTRAKPSSLVLPESPEVCAARELEEETGYRAGTMRPLASWLTAPGLTDELMHFFLATELTQVGQRLEPDESIQALVVPASMAFAMLDSGEISDAKTMLALLWARRAGVI